MLLCYESGLDCWPVSVRRGHPLIGVLLKRFCVAPIIEQVQLAINDAPSPGLDISRDTGGNISIKNLARTITTILWGVSDRVGGEGISICSAGEMPGLAKKLMAELG